ncbi:polysaccharide pyruvyl transferase family protein [Leucobacter aridicollis]|uniref:Polysaccharide pyruvyl transferase domain-containing protein n=1 Tax=Leucobacter aridicollis TaxID=283878 RepID=A0A852QV72_9MICO|nr:polysaccharide pyruvyl transferase family protein [Leucobacter aridicollis]NYD25211.1 hypothetical protein [Leucobacter aridicollis]
MSIRSRELVYLGWQGEGNFGDELIYDYWRAALGRKLDVKAPLILRKYLMRRAPRFLADRAKLLGRDRAILLGGGTTIGFAAWANHTRLAQRMFGAHHVFSAGAGIAAADDSFTLRTQPQDWNAWRANSGLRTLGIRGPLSQREFAREIGWAPVVGDPALAYPDVVRLSPITRPVIGLSLGSEGSSRFSVAAVAAAVRSAADILGYGIVLFQMTDADAPVNAELAVHLGPVEVVEFDGDVVQMMNRIAGCAAFVSERLHGTIAAVAAGVPATPLPYASKCDDFWLSVADERPRLTATSSSEEMTAEILRSMEPAVRSGIAARTAAYRAAHATLAQELREWLAGGTSEPGASSAATQGERE